MVRPRSRPLIDQDGLQPQHLPCSVSLFETRSSHLIMASSWMLSLSVTTMSRWSFQLSVSVRCLGQRPVESWRWIDVVLAFVGECLKMWFVINWKSDETDWGQAALFCICFTTFSKRFRLTGKEKRVGGFDLIWDDGPVLADDALDCTKTAPIQHTNSFLGASKELHNTHRTEKN